MAEAPISTGTPWFWIKQAQLLHEVVGEQVGPRHRRRIGAGLGDMAEAQPRVDGVVARRGEADFRIEGAHPGGRDALGQRPPEALGQERYRGVVMLGEARRRRLGVAEALVPRHLGRQDAGRFGGRVHPAAPLPGGSAFSSTGVSANRVTSTSPRSEIRSSGITTSARSECCI